jgi:hypothetical protein
MGWMKARSRAWSVLENVFQMLKLAKFAQISSAHAKLSTRIHDQPIIATAMAVR